jgi:hypothetical protein
VKLTLSGQLFFCIDLYIEFNENQMNGLYADSSSDGQSNVVFI